jgi:hypothetical protein
LSSALGRAGILGCALLAALGCARLRGKTDVARPAAFSQGESRTEPAETIVLAEEEDFVVRVVAGEVTCSGALIDDDKVLTAHHCMSKRSRTGEMLSKDVAAETVTVELGGDHFAWGEVGVRAIITPTCGYAAGEGDIAILVLERALVGVATRAAQLDRAPATGLAIEPVGFGRCVHTSNVIRRTARKGGTVDHVAHSRFQTMASICPGDSGGPALDAKTGEIVGVISASVMDASERTLGRSEFTRLDSWRQLFSHAQMVSEGMSPSELPPVECQ